MHDTNRSIRLCSDACWAVGGECGLDPAPLCVWGGVGWGGGPKTVTFDVMRTCNSLWLSFLLVMASVHLIVSPGAQSIGGLSTNTCWPQWVEPA